MSILSQVTKGKIDQPILTCIYGPDGVGKSTFGAEAPKSIFVGSEKGTANLDVARLPTPRSFSELLAQLTALAVEKHDYQTVVLDSADWIEPLIWTAVCEDDPKKPSMIEEACGGYQKGYIKALDFWRNLYSHLNNLRDTKKMNVVIIAHAMIKAFNDPSTPAPYDRYQLKLHDKAGSLLREYVDSVLFFNHEVLGRKENVKDKKIKAYGDDERVVYTRRRPNFDAKNRYGLPFEIKMTEGFMWETFMKHVKVGQPDSLTTVQEELVELQSAIKNEETVAKMKSAIEKAGADIAKLVNIRNHARILAGEAA